MRSKLSLFLAPFVAAAGALAASACDGPAQRPDVRRYRVEALAHDIDPASIPDRFATDFDEDGQIDRVVVTDTSLHVLLTGGGSFDYVVGAAEWDSGNWLEDIEVISLRPDRAYPSIILATHRVEPDGDWGVPSVQIVVVNDRGTLDVRRLHNLSMPAVSVECAWIESNDLPVCFYGSYFVKDVSWGLSALIEIDVDGWRHLQSDSLARAQAAQDVANMETRLRRWASDSTYRAHRQQQDLQWAELGWVPAGTGSGSAWDLTPGLMDRPTFDHLAASAVPQEAVSAYDTSVAVTRAFLEEYDQGDFVRGYWYGYLGTEKYDSVLKAWGVPESASAVDVQVALLGAWQEKDEWVYARDITREYRLPWPVAWPQYWLGTEDGILMYGVQFFDFSGDGLLDLVGAGLHSRVFSAMQHPDGYFVDARFHSPGGEYLGVWAPSVSSGAQVTMPPCVFLAMKRITTRRPSDIVRCWDGAAGEWYEIELPEGPWYALEMGPAINGSAYQGTEGAALKLYVPFWDMNDDGMVDFTARGEDGSWTTFTFVEDSG